MHIAICMSCGRNNIQTMKLKERDWILDKVVFNNIGQEIIRRWNEGDGSWLDIVDSEYKTKDSYLLDFKTLQQQDELIDNQFKTIKRGGADQYDYVSTVVILDSLYSTQLKNTVRIGELIYNSPRIRSGIEEIVSLEKEVYESQVAIEFLDAIATIFKREERGTYIYSFAMK